MTRSLLAASVALAILSANLHAQSHFGNALTLTGDTSYVDVGNHDVYNFPGTPFTISTWFKTTANVQQRLLYRFDIGTINGFAVFVDFGKIIGAVWGPSFFSLEEPSLFGGPQRYNDGEWHHVAFVRDGSRLTLIVDGNTMQSRDDAPVYDLTNNASVTIGADAVPEDLFFFDGQIDEMRVWNTPRSESQVRATMFDTLGPAYYSTPDSGLIGYYRFDQLEDLGSGAPGANDIRDFSTSQLHGDVVGQPDLTPTMDEDFTRPRLTLQFKGMGPHVGQKFEVRVVDQDGNREVARHTLPAIETPDFELWLNALIAGHSYTVDFYADLNGNKKYDSPPSDHAWRMTLDPAVGNDVLTFEHDITFLDIGWPPLIDFALYEAIWKGLGQNSDGSTFDLSVTYRGDAVSETLDGMLEAHDVLGLFDLIQIYFNGTFSAAADTARVTTSDAPSGKRTADDWSGLLRYSNNGRVTSDVHYEALGMTADFSLEGTIGKTQAVLSYHSDMLDLDGTLLFREDSVLTKSLVAVDEDQLPGLAGNLEQNYPNPFRPITHIPFTMPENGTVEIAVFDLLGRRVATLMDGYSGAGEHTVAFDGSDLSTGIYTYRMKARLDSGKRISESKRLAIVR